MPELPEVESIARQIHKSIISSTCEHVQFFRKDLRFAIPIQGIKKVLLQESCQRVFRRSKYILLETPKGFVIFHLGMSGNILLSDKKEPFHKHTHAVFHFADKGENLFMHFVDPRRFGLIDVHKGGEWETHKLFSHMGLEPLETRDLGKRLHDVGKKRQLPIKSFLMDAKILAGVGNIYACEALFLAGLHPFREASSLTVKQYEKLAKAVQETLTRAIEAGGTSFRDFKSTEGQPGYFAVSLNVYGKKNGTCTRCQTALLREALQGRSTWYCPSCQK
ncbi:MAG: bifunctional DNA-formamidopyrimidine glycosylase/DNA-(apurinic or apyrimidinic site) lyase [Oligoflexales bacterium]|nr:bifunctional DNA-formamidopyrimidine glycosylase/DNA-(apurinic or apyrimidinic site) lyase [Oligoflexales bacterium]